MTFPASRAEAQKILEEHVKDPYQLLHAKMNALALEANAKKLGENDSTDSSYDKDFWYITGLLHDLDYYEFPEEHPKRELMWFKEWGYPEEFIHAVEAHGYGVPGFNTEPQTLLAKTLLATDELCGFLHAYSLMRPEGYKGMNASKAIKKFKDKKFAAKIDRDLVKFGIHKLGVDLTQYTQFLIDTFQEL